MREFSKWCAREIERVCERNDKPRPGKPLKPPWEKQPPGILKEKIKEEYIEAFGGNDDPNVHGAYDTWENCPIDKNREAVQWELADLAATAMMLSARLDPVVSGLRRGRVREREFPK